MVKDLTMLLRAVVSRRALAELYEKRRALLPSEGNRTRLAVAWAVGLFAMTLAFLLVMAWTRGDSTAYVKGKTRIQLLPDVGWEAGPTVRHSCLKPEECLRELMRLAPGFTPVDKMAPPFAPPPGLAADEVVSTRWRVTLDPRWWSRLEDRDALVVTLPAFAHRRAHVYLGGVYRGSFYDRAWIGVSFRGDELPRGGGVPLDVILEARAGQERLAPPLVHDDERVSPLDRLVAVMPVSEQRAYVDFRAANRAARGDFVGQIARVAMAVFVLALFLVIDGSRETLGLALFLGFEAVAISCAYGWLPLENPDLVRHYAFQMGDIFRLYFFLQLARVIEGRLGSWLFWGSVLSLPYAWGRYAHPTTAWLLELPTHRDFAVGLIGTVVLLRGAWYLRDKQLPWRVMAMLVAALGAFEQVYDPLTGYVPLFKEIPALRLVADIFQPVSAWLLAFSAFINISTLENRVKVLSVAQARASEMEKELELGRTVQRSFMTLPATPPALSIACHNEAMLYVSGDTLFVDWSERHQRLSFLVTDVTGHGPSAALKASGVTVIANAVWRDDEEDRWSAGKLQSYARRVQRFYERMDVVPDIVAIGGGEFDARSGELALFRENFPYPLLIEPATDGGWTVSLVPLPHGRLTVRRLTPGSFVVIASDGVVDDSKQAAYLVRRLARELAERGRDLTAEEVKALMLRTAKAARPDDKTVVVFQWRPEAQAGTDAGTGAGVSAA